MVARRTHEEIEQIVNSMGYDLLDEYSDEKWNARKVIVRDRYGYKYLANLSEFITRGGRGYIVDSQNPFSTENLRLWLTINKKDLLLCEDSHYSKNKEKMKFYHTICDEFFYMNWNNLSQGNQNCPVCSGQQVGVKTSLEYLRPDLSEEWDETNELKASEITAKSNRIGLWKCKTCNHKWRARPNDRAGRGNGCPKCSESKGEKSISNWLFKNHIYNIPEAVFPECKNKRELPFDFYFPDYNLCIEYDGILHYKDKFNDPEEFKNAKKRDKIKTKFCKDNNINLLRIPYWEFDNIESILERTFQL